jgi:hypothetical protein
MWIIIQTKNSKRWSKLNENKLQKTKKTKNQKNNQGNNQNKTKKSLFFYKIVTYYFIKLRTLHWVGFEPTRPKPCELESHPLDHSGTNAEK